MDLHTLDDMLVYGVNDLVNALEVLLDDKLILLDGGLLLETLGEEVGKGSPDGSFEEIAHAHSGVPAGLGDLTEPLIAERCQGKQAHLSI